MVEPTFSKQKTLPDLVSSKDKVTPCPKQIGPYKIESLLNKGGMSFLYLGTMPQSTKPLVVKVLSPKYVQHKEMVDRFLKEAHIIGMTNHPNIVKLHGQGKWEKGLYIAMEFIQGISLRQFIQQKSLSQKRALEIILQVAYALCHLHTHGVIHRDLKPENILITESGEVKVIDFGIAQLLGDVDEHRITQKKRLMGTPIYMSPEQKESPNTVSFASDIFSLGVITYELVLGRLSHGVIQLSLLPKALRSIIGKALKIDPKQRYQDIVDFITDISQYMKNYREEKEFDEEEQADEVIDIIHQTQQLLFTKKPPSWPQLDIAIAYKEGLSLTGLYIDFFHLPENHFVIVMAEPTKTGIASLIPVANLRGMVRQALQEADTSKTNSLHPATFLNSINQTLSNDSIEDNFAVSFLFLHQEDNCLSFVSCAHNNLWQIPSGSKKIISLATPNSLLGEDPNATIVETASNWNFGDKLLLFSLGCINDKEKENIKKQDELKGAISDNVTYSAKGQAKKILDRMVSNFDDNFPNRIASVISIQRTF